MARQSIILMNSTNTDPSAVGLPVRAAGYYGSGKNLHTLAIYLSNFSGRVYLDATLASCPQEDDWFSVNLADTTTYIEYLYDTSITTPNDHRGVTKIDTLSFMANFTYLRFRMDRGDLPNPLTTDYGSVQRVLINY